MGCMNRRLQRLEANRENRAQSLTAEALRLLSDEDLQALDEETEEALERGGGDFWDLFATTQEKSRRALDALFEELEAVQSGEEPPEDLSDTGVLDLVRDVNEGDEEAKREYDRQDGYRIWKHFRKELR
jgi:hypothetical protein